MTFQPGVAANPNGRPKGSRNRRTQEIFDIIEARGDKDPIDVLSDLITNTTNDELKVQACSILAPYKHSKRSPALTPRFIEEPVVVPEFPSVDDAENFLAEIPRRVALGELDFQSGLDLSTMVKTWIDSRRAAIELDLKVQAQGGGEQVIRIDSEWLVSGLLGSP
jgi:hypothetical protein